MGAEIITRRNGADNPALALCTCGRQIVLHDPLDNYCNCGRVYNMSGQSVIPSNQCDAQGEPYDYD